MIEFDLPEEKAYSAKINRKTLMEINKGVRKYIIVGKRYRNASYTAKTLAEDIGVNTRYLSAALQLYYNCNFNELVNRYRVEDAKEMLLNDENEMTMEEVALSNGFATRQSFYNAFAKFVGIRPKEWVKTQKEQQRLSREQELRERQQETPFTGLAFD